MRRLAVLGLVVSAACGSRAFWGDGGQSPDAGSKPGQAVFEIQRELNRDVDILFVVDSSGGTDALQDKLIAGFATYTSVLKNLPGGLPNIHIGVISSDIGAGAFDVSDIPTCRHGGDQAIFQSRPRGTTCANGSLAAGAHFISNVNGMPNYTGSLEDVFGCIAKLGSAGCGFEHPFGSLLRALGADGNGGSPSENVGFLRENAYLSIVIMTDEDDCSAPINSDLFDPTSRLVTDPLGPLASYRCNEYGHVCGGKRPPRTPGGRVDLTGTCSSAEDGRLLRVADVANALKSLKAVPSKVLVSIIGGPPAPYVVELVPPTLPEDPNRWPAIAHSCMAADGTDADPGIRLKQLVDAFDGNGVFEEICSDTFVPAFQRIAEQIGKVIGPTCVPVSIKIVDADPATLALEPDCTAIDHTFNDNGTLVDTPVPGCAEVANAAPCWELGPETPVCGTGKPIQFRRASSAGSGSTTVTCKVCEANDARPGCGY
jgi:hypothetical protein